MKCNCVVVLVDGKRKLLLMIVHFVWFSQIGPHLSNENGLPLWLLQRSSIILMSYSIIIAIFSLNINVPFDLT